MDLKAFKGLPHEFGGIDYTEGSEVEGGEFAVNIGKSGNEYIFDKNSSEGEKLSKEFKRLDANGRLSEDDPLALEAFDQIAREEALKHAQRSVNEKGVDPFRNMYEQGGQAANGGVKYATGGPMMNPAEVANVNPGAQYNTSMSYAPKTAEEYYRQTQGESRMRDSFGTQAMREAPTQQAFKEIGEAKEAGMLIGDIFLTPITSAFTGKSFSEMAMGDMGYTSSDATKRAVGDDTMTGTAFGYGFAESEGVISNMGTQFFNMMGADGGAMPKDKYAEGGSKGQQIGNAIDYPSGSLGSMIGGGSTGTPWMKIFEGIHNFKQGMKQATGPAIDEMIANNLGEEYVRQPIAGQPTTSSSNFGNLFGGMDFSKSKRGQTNTAPAGGATGETKQEGEQPVLDQGESFGLKPSAMDVNSSLYGSQNYFNPYTDFSSDPMFADPGRYSDVRIQYKKGGAKPIYGYYANGGGKKANSNNAYEDYLIAREKELAFKAATEGPYGINYSDVMYGPSNIESQTNMRTEVDGGNSTQSFRNVSENRNIGASSLSPGFDVRIETDALNDQANQKFFTRNNATGDISTGINGTTQFQNGGGKKKDESYDGMKDPAQWDIMQNYIASNDTRDRMSQAAVGSGDEMYAPYRVDNTCVAGVNCFEDLAGVQGIPDDIYNNRALRDFFESKEGKKSFRKVKNERPGDYVQFENTFDPRGINYPFHLGMVAGDNRYLGDGSSDNPLYYNTINKQPSIQTAGIEFTNTNPNFYRMRDKKNRKKVIDAALQAKQQGKDVIRPTLGEEATGYLPLQQYRKNTPYPIAGL
jgi:hypothetical protein